MRTYRDNGGVVSHAAMKAGMDRKTAAQYLRLKESPEERQGHAPKRTRRRPDPLAGGLWDAAVSWLELTPELDAKTLFEHLWAAAATGLQRLAGPCAHFSGA